MLRIRRDQISTLQAALDPPVVAHYVATYRDEAADAGISPEELRERVTRGVALGRELDARAGYELSAVVALTALVDPQWRAEPPCQDVLDLPDLSLEAKLRIIFTMFAEASEGDA